MGRGREKRKSQKRHSQNQRRSMQEKVRKLRNTVFFPWFSMFFHVLRMLAGGSKSRLAKAAGGEPSGQLRDQKLHAVVAQSRFRSRSGQSTSFSEHFWKLSSRKSARGCGVKHISKSKRASQSMFGAEDFWKLRCSKSVPCCGAKMRTVITFLSQNVQNASAVEIAHSVVV